MPKSPGYEVRDEAAEKISAEQLAEIVESSARRLADDDYAKNIECRCGHPAINHLPGVMGVVANCNNCQCKVYRPKPSAAAEKKDLLETAARAIEEGSKGK